MKIIDAHNHPDWHGYDFQKIVENMEKYHIDQSWLMSWESPLKECCEGTAGLVCGSLFGKRDVAIPFERCVAYAERAPEKFILGFCPDPRDPQAANYLKAAHDIYGAKVCGECKFRTTYDSPDCTRLFRKAGELGMPVTLHFDYDWQTTIEKPWGEWWGGDMQNLEHLLQLCPDTNFLGHAPAFWINISKDDLWKQGPYPPEKAKVVEGGAVPTLLRKYPNLYCDISAGSGCRALRRDPEFAKQFILEFQDRILYARDYFDNIHQEFLNSLELPTEVLEKLYHKNAEKLIHDS